MQIRAAFRTIEFVLPVPPGSPVIRSGTVQCELGCWRSWLRWLHRGHRQFASQAVQLLHMPAAEGKAAALVHVLSCTIRAEAWEAAMGGHRSGQTWVKPTVADDITIKNASTVEPARALVVLITNETSSLEPQDQGLMQTWRGCLPIIGYFAELQERHAMTQTSEPGIKSEHSEGERTRGNRAQTTNTEGHAISDNSGHGKGEI